MLESFLGNFRKYSILSTTLKEKETNKKYEINFT